MDGQERFTLAEIGSGATVERFDMAMQEVLDNIQDVNTDPKKPRSVVLKVTIHPDEDRGVGKYMIDVQSKLAPIRPHPGRVFLGRDGKGRGVASEEHPTQVEMGDVMKSETQTYKLVQGAGKDKL
jgi:hypothetical protein